jgi:hypothetical protein
MRRSMRMLVLTAVCAVGAFAQVGEISVSVGAARLRNNSLGSFTDATTGAVSTLSVDSNFRFGFRFTINSWKFFGHEIGYAYNHSTLKEGSAGSVGMPIHQGMYNFLAYATPEGSRIRPFATGGVHFSTFYPPGACVLCGNGVTKFGINYGGGVKFKITSAFLGRLDIRDYENPKPDFGTGPSGWLHLLEVSAGFGLGF